MVAHLDGGNLGRSTGGGVDRPRLGEAAVSDEDEARLLRRSGEQYTAAVRGLDRALRIFAVAVVAYAVSGLLLLAAVLRSAGCRAGWWAC